MSRLIDRSAVRRLLADQSAQLIEVLPRDDFDLEHIAGAINLPLRELNTKSVRRLDRARPIVVYCNDFQ